MLSNNDHAKVNKVLYEFEHALQRGKISTFIDYAVENNLLWIKVEGKGLMIELEKEDADYIIAMALGAIAGMIHEFEEVENERFE